MQVECIGCAGYVIYELFKNASSLSFVHDKVRKTLNIVF